MAPVDRLERLTDLVLVLLHSSTPRSLDEIVQVVPGYPASRVARRQAFERDKRILRDEGIPVVTEPLTGPDQFGYRIAPETFYLADPGLTADERGALRLAVAGVRLGDPSGRDALAKLGASGTDAVQPLIALGTPETLVDLFDALRLRAQVAIVYHDERREVTPETIEFRGGRWYLVGWDQSRQARRIFRVDRIAELVGVGDPGSAERGRGDTGAADSRDPEGSPASELEPWGHEESQDHVEVRVDAVEGPRIAAEVGDANVVARGNGGSAVVRLGVTRFPALRSWVLALGVHAQIVGPRSARDAVVAWLETIRDAEPSEPDTSPDQPSASASDPPQDLDAPDHETATTADGGVEVRSASTRLRRLLAMVSWLAEVREAPLEELCARFHISPDEAVRELELAACCGTPPYSPDTLLEIVVDATSIRAFLPEELARPRRLTPAEGLAVAASARAILSVPGADRHGLLARALEKLERVLGDRPGLVVHMDAPELLDSVRAALERGVQIEIEYHSASTDTTGRRVVEPMDVRSIDGHWYLDAWCHQAGDARRFRVDRIRTVKMLDAPIARRVAPQRTHPDAFIPGPGVRTVTLRLAPGARWVEDTIPVRSARDGPEGTRDVALSVGGLPWLESLLLQLGPDARVIAPDDLRLLGSRAAARLLTYYGTDTMRQHETA